MANLSAGVSTQSENSKEKIMTSLSVSQVAYLIRIFHDLEIISCQNKSDFLGRVAHCVITKNTPEISLKSLKAKFYTVDPATKESVKNLLLELLNAID